MRALARSEAQPSACGLCLSNVQNQLPRREVRMTTESRHECVGALISETLKNKPTFFRDMSQLQTN
eukprot:3615418-Amphidinium_carterae.1